jgi:predicted dinucleotide-binding enzyme
MEKIGILGSGVVGQSLGKGFARSGYNVMIGTRDKTKLNNWKKETGNNVSVGTNEEAAKFGDILVMATKWAGTENAINLAGKDNFKNKIVIDVTNPLQFEKENAIPRLAVAYPDSAGKTVQRWLPHSLVVKAFNIVSANHMTNPKLEEGIADLFIAGNNSEAKKKVKEIAKSWGWAVNDIGSIDNSYTLESLAMLWIIYGYMNNQWSHAFKLLKK